MTHIFKNIRIVIAPLLVAADGSLLSREHNQFAQFILDPLKYDEDGLREAALYSKPISLARTLAELATNHESAYSDMILNTEQGRQVYSGFTREDKSEDSMERYLLSTRNEALRAENLFSVIMQQRELARSSDSNTLKRHPYLSPEEVKACISKLKDTGYANSDEFVKDAHKGKTTILSLIDTLPDYLKCKLDEQKLTIATIAGLDSNGRFIQNANLILLAQNLVFYGKPKVAALVVREEITHYVDQITGFSDSKEFRAAAEKFFSDPAKVKKLDEFTAKIDGHEKGTLQQYSQRYPPHIMRQELLSEYVHAKEDMQASGKSGCALPFVSRLQNPEKKIDAKLIELFGEEIHSLCKQFTQNKEKSPNNTRRNA